MGGRSLSGASVSLLMSASMEMELNNSEDDVASVNHPSLSYRKTFTTGVDEDQANRGWQLVRVIWPTGKV